MLLGPQKTTGHLEETLFVVSIDMMVLRTALVHIIHHALLLTHHIEPETHQPTHTLYTHDHANLMPMIIGQSLIILLYPYYIRYSCQYTHISRQTQKIKVKLFLLYRHVWDWPKHANVIHKDRNRHVEKSLQCKPNGDEPKTMNPMHAMYTYISHSTWKCNT